MNCEKCGTELEIDWDYSDHQEGAKFAGYKSCPNCSLMARLKRFFRGSASELTEEEKDE